MENRLTGKDLETLQYRKRRLERKLGQLERLLSGRRKSLLPLLRTASGEYSEEKTRTLARELTACLEASLQAEPAYGRAPELPLSALSPALDQSHREFYPGFLYCLLRFVEDPPPWSFLEQGSFEALLEMSRDLLEYREAEGFYLDTVYRRVYNSPVWLWLDRAYEAFSGSSTEQLLSPEDISAVEKRYPGGIAQARELAELSEMAQRGPEPSEAFPVTLEPWERKALEEEEAARRTWLEGFAEKEAFCREYPRWRRLYFDLRAWEGLEQRLEDMVDVYLYRDGSSSFLTDRAFSSAYALLDQALRQLGALLSEQE